MDVRRLIVMVVGAVLAACSGSGGESAPTDVDVETSSFVSSVATSTLPGDASTSTAPTDDQDLLVLPDVVVPRWAPESRTDELALAISRQQLPEVQLAVDAYGLLDPEMPGQTPFAIPAGDGLGASYTLALIDSVRDQLSPEQIAVLDAADDGDVLIGRIVPDEVAADRQETTPPNTSAAHRFVSQDPSDSSCVVLPIARATRIQARYLRLAYETCLDWRRYRPDLPLISPMVLKFSNVPFKSSDMSTTSTLARDGSRNARAADCIISVHPRMWKAHKSDDTIQRDFAHEMFHCIQNAWTTFDFQPPWLYDGSADFASLDLYRSRSNPEFNMVWPDWYTVPGMPLERRQYDAWPLFETLRSTGADPYRAIEVMYLRSLTNDNNVGFLLQAGGMYDLQFRMAWSSRALRSRTLDSEWQLGWPAVNTELGPRDNVFHVGTRGVGTWGVLGTADFTHPQPRVHINHDVGVMAVTPARGPMTTWTGSQTVTIAEGSTAWLCFDAGRCVCPDGQTWTIQMTTSDVIFSFPASEHAPSAGVEARRWDASKLCPKAATRFAMSLGDPHLVTFDGLPYDVMTLGEFVNARDPQGGFEVQTRHQRLGHNAAMTSAVALGDGEHRITFTNDGTDLRTTVRVDGEPTTERSFEVGNLEVFIVEQLDFYFVTWMDGTVVTLMWNRGWNVIIDVGTDRAARLEGLLGAADHDLRNDLRMPDGTIVDAAEASQADSRFSLAWAVDESSTLFDYGPGQSVATFRTPQPEGADVKIDSARREECAQALGADATTFEVESCAFDYTVTDDDVYLDTYATVVEGRLSYNSGGVFEVEGAPRPADSAVTTTVRPQPAGSSFTMSGTVCCQRWDTDLGKKEISRVVDAKEGTVLLARIDSCEPDARISVEVRHLDNADNWASAYICYPRDDPYWDLEMGTYEPTDEVIVGETYFWLASGGDHEVVVRSEGETPRQVNVTVVTDTTPMIQHGSAIAGGATATLQGDADTVVYLISGMKFTTIGLGEACAFEFAIGAEHTVGAVYALNYCGHLSEIDLEYWADPPAPVIVFARSTKPVTIKLEPTD